MIRKILIIVVLLLGIVPSAYSIHPLEISEVYIEAKGNNRYEAKIKAHEEGMQRALLMIADKMGINGQDVQKPPYNILRSIFTTADVMNEMESEEAYSATVTYKYDINTVNKIFLKYGNQTVHNKFYDYLVLPIFKQKKLLTIWDNKEDWNRKWLKLHDILDSSKLFYPKVTPLIAQEINPVNVFYLTYEDFLELFYGKLFKKVLIVVCEYFTDSSNGKVIMDVKYMSLGDDQGRTVTQDLYPIESIEDISKVMNHAIITAIKKHGVVDHAKEEAMSVILNASKDRAPVQVEEDNVKKIILNLDAFDEKELMIIEEKLNKVHQIEKYELKHDIGTKYRISITTRYSEFELAEGFYENGLSFKVYGKLYKLIDIKHGA